MITTKRELERFLIDHAEGIRAFGVERLGVFGSFARGDQTMDSDIDFMVEFQPGQKSFRNFMDLANYLEDHVGRRIELVTPEGLSDRAREKILAKVEYLLPVAA